MKEYSGYSSFAQKWAEMVRSGKHYSHEFYEKPAMYAKVPDLRNKTVLCLGCGTGEECTYLQSLGPDKIVGIDAVKEMIDIAKESFPTIDFRVMDIRTIDFEKNSFDFVYSSLALHYIKNWVPVLQSIHEILKDDGSFLFSTHHFFLGGSEEINEEIKPGKSLNGLLFGYKENKLDNNLQIYGDYFNERKISQIWFGSLEVEFYHKTLQTIFREISQSGFEIVDIVEPSPKSELKTLDESRYLKLSKIPYFIIFELKKRKN